MPMHDLLHLLWPYLISQFRINYMVSIWTQVLIACSLVANDARTNYLGEPIPRTEHGYPHLSMALDLDLNAIAGIKHMDIYSNFWNHSC